MRHRRRRRKNPVDQKTKWLLMGAAGIGAFFLIRRMTEVHAAVIPVTRPGAGRVGAVVRGTIDSIIKGAAGPVSSTTSSPFRRAQLGTEAACVDTRTGDFVDVSNCAGQPALSGWQSGYVRSYR